MLSTFWKYIYIYIWFYETQFNIELKLMATKIIVRNQNAKANEK